MGEVRYKLRIKCVDGYRNYDNRVRFVKFKVYGLKFIVSGELRVESFKRVVF